MSDSLTWLTEDPTPIFIIGGLVAVVFVAVTWFTGRAVFLLGTVLALAAMFGGWLVDRLVVTDREQVTDVIYQGAAALQDNRLDDVLKLVAPASRALETEARHYLHVVKFSEVKVTTEPEIVINKLTSPKSAVANFVVVLAGKFQPGETNQFRIPLRLTVNFEWQSDRWLATDAQWKVFTAGEGEDVAL